MINIIDDKLKGIDITLKRDKLFEKHNLDDFYKNIDHYESSNSYITTQSFRSQMLKKEYVNNKNNSYAFLNDKIQNHRNNCPIYTI